MQRFPACRFYNLDKIDYCGTTKNLDAIANAPNYTFVKVRAFARPDDVVRTHGLPAQLLYTFPRHRAASRRPIWSRSCCATSMWTPSCTLPPSPTSVRPPARPRPPPRTPPCPDRNGSLRRFPNAVDRSFESSFDFTHDNVLGTHVLLEAARVRASRVAAALLILIARSVNGRAPHARSTASSGSST